MTAFENRITLYKKLTQQYADKQVEILAQYQDKLAKDGFTKEEIEIIRTELYPECLHENETGRACSKCGQRIT